MRLKIEIKTPAGQATVTARRIQPFILGKAKTQNKVYSNKADDCIIWIVDGDSRDMFRIQRNVILFDKTVSSIMSNRTVLALAKISPQDRMQLRDMLENHTTVRLVKGDEPDTQDWQES